MLRGLVGLGQAGQSLAQNLAYEWWFLSISIWHGPEFGWPNPAKTLKISFLAKKLVKNQQKLAKFSGQNPSPNPTLARIPGLETLLAAWKWFYLDVYNLLLWLVAMECVLHLWVYALIVCISNWYSDISWHIYNTLVSYIWNPKRPWLWYETKQDELKWKVESNSGAYIMLNMHIIWAEAFTALKRIYLAKNLMKN